MKTSVTPRVSRVPHFHLYGIIAESADRLTKLRGFAGFSPVAGRVAERHRRAVIGVHLPQIIHTWLPDRRKPARMRHYFQSVTPSLQKISMIYPAVALFQWLSRLALILGKLDRTVRIVGARRCFRDLCTELSTNLVDIAVSTFAAPMSAYGPSCVAAGSNRARDRRCRVARRRRLALYPLPSRMVTGPQIRAARALLGWPADQLAERSGVSPATVWRAENAEGVPSIRAQNLFLLLRTLEQGGVRFIDAEGGEGVGVRLRR